MPRFWLASYPKSGNTWLRLLLANIGREEPVSINGFGGRHSGIASAREWFERALHLPSALLTHAECDLLRPLVYSSDDIMTEETKARPRLLEDISFCKVHDAYDLLGDGAPMMAGRDGAAGAILIVRDPRDIVASLANHLGRGVDQAIRVMSDPDAALCDIVTGQRNQLRQRLRSWSEHTASWLQQRDIPVHLVRYEALHHDPVRTLTDAVAFCGVSLSEADALRAVAFADFGGLRSQEDGEGFREAPIFNDESARFFRNGKSGGWRDELSVEQVRAVEAAHGQTMQQLHYSLHYPEAFS